MDKPQASALYEKLVGALGPDEARSICKGKIDKGELVDDLGVAPVVTKKDMDAFLEMMTKGLKLDDKAPAAAVATLRPQRLVKGASAAAAPEGTDFSALEDAVAAIEARLDAATQADTHHYSQLVKGITTLGDLNKASFVALAEMDRRATDLANEVRTLTRAVESIAKGGPRAVQTGTAVVPTPAERADTAAAAATAAAAGTVSIDAEEALFDKVHETIHAQLQKGDVPEARKTELRFALGELESGALPSRVNSNYSLGLK